MPHVVIECSDNLLGILRQEDVCRKAYDVLLQSGLFKAPDIKTRLHPAALSYVGPKGGEGSFVHALIYLLEGRTAEARKNLAASLLAALGETVPKADSVTVDITEIKKEFYQKRVRV
jgi:5-carboxymethyl-2-hydroxymuconate isomerase